MYIFHVGGLHNKTNYNILIMLFLTDEDECKTGRNSCGHICYNDEGSYKCSCHKGYKLFPDGSCKGNIYIILLFILVHCKMCNLHIAFYFGKM